MLMAAAWSPVISAPYAVAFLARYGEMSPANETWAATRAATFSKSTVTNMTNSSSPSSPDLLTQRKRKAASCSESPQMTRQ
jgi:hypothetical protein